VGSCHTGGEAERPAAFQSADRLLECLPGGVAVAAVSELGGAHLMRANVGRREDHRRIEWRIHDSVGAASGNRDSFRPQPELRGAIRIVRLLGHKPKSGAYAAGSARPG